MVEEHFSLREMEKKKREAYGEREGDEKRKADKKRKSSGRRTTDLHAIKDIYRKFSSGTGSDKEEAIHLRHYLEVLYHRKWIVLFVSLIVMSSALYTSISAEPFFKAKTQILHKEGNAGGMASLASRFGVPSGASQGTSLETLAVVSKTSPLLEKVIQELQYDLTKYDLDSMIDVKADIDTSILEISVTAPEEKMAIDVANVFAKSFIQYNIEIERSEANKAYVVLGEQIEKTKGELSILEEKIRKFSHEENIVSVKQEINVKMNQKANLESKIRALDSQLISKKVELTQVKKRLLKEEPTLVTETTATKPLQRQLINLEMQLATALTRRTGEHPEVIAIKNNINSIKNLIKQKLEENVKVETIGRNPVRDNFLSKLATIETLIAAFSAQREALLKLSKDLSLEMEKLPDKQIKFARLERQKKSIEEIFVELQSRFQESRLAKEIHVGNLHHLQPAEEAEIIQKDSMQSGILGLVVGLTIGIGLAFFLEQLDHTVKSVKQVRDLFGLNTIGIIPLFSDKEKIIDLHKPESMTVETYRLLQNNLRYTSFIYNKKTIIIASTQRGEGSTTTTINLGLSAILQGKSVLLIDCDLRRASLSKFFGTSRKEKRSKKDQDFFGVEEEGKIFTAGLSDYLVDEAELSDIIQEADIPKLFFIPAGTRVPNTSELLSSEKMSDLFGILEEKVDVIFVDTPAVLPVVDATVIASMGDSLLFLIESRNVTIEAAKQSLDRLTQANSNIIGCVINKMRLDKKHQYYYDDNEDLEEMNLATHMEAKGGWFGKSKI